MNGKLLLLVGPGETKTATIPPGGFELQVRNHCGIVPVRLLTANGKRELLFEAKGNGDYQVEVNEPFVVRYDGANTSMICMAVLGRNELNAV